MEFLDEIVSGVASSVAVGTGALALTKWKGRLRIVRLVRSEEPEAEGFLELYESLFAANGPHEYTVEEIETLLDADKESPQPFEVDNYLYAAVVQKQVLGLLIMHYYPGANRCIISYLGSRQGSPAAAVKEATRCLATRALRDMKRAGCKMLLIETECDPEAPGRSTRLRRFRQLLKKAYRSRLVAGLPGGRACPIKLRTLDIDFIQPRVRLDHGEHQPSRHLELSVCYLRGAESPEGIPRQEAASILEWLLRNCYGDRYPQTDPRFQPFQDFLGRRARELVAPLPDVVGYRA